MWSCHHYQHLTLKRSIKINSKWICLALLCGIPVWPHQHARVSAKISKAMLFIYSSLTRAHWGLALVWLHQVYSAICVYGDRSCPIKMYQRKYQDTQNNVLQNPSNIYPGHLTVPRSIHGGETQLPILWNCQRKSKPPSSLPDNLEGSIYQAHSQNALWM